jgi:hypothetical protein
MSENSAFANRLTSLESPSADINAQWWTLSPGEAGKRGRKRQLNTDAERYQFVSHIQQQNYTNRLCDASKTIDASLFLKLEGCLVHPLKIHLSRARRSIEHTERRCF